MQPALIIIFIIAIPSPYFNQTMYLTGIFAKVNGQSEKFENFRSRINPLIQCSNWKLATVSSTFQTRGSESTPQKFFKPGK